MMTRGMILIAATVLAATPSLAADLKHGFMMKGHVVAHDGKTATLCVGKEDGAAAGQVLSAYRISAKPGARSGFTRAKVGEVKIDQVFDEHFAKASVVSGSVADHDLVELRKPGS